MPRSSRLESTCETEPSQTHTTCFDPDIDGSGSSSTAARTFAKSDTDNSEDVDSIMEIYFACQTHNIPAVSMDEIGEDDMWARQSGGIFSLGEGLTSHIIRHATGPEVQAFMPPKTLVALKFFALDRSRKSPQNGKMRRVIYDALLREMKIFMNHRISRHPNIIQLAYIGWPKNSIYPVLAMELGLHGSLNFIIKHSPSALSTLQRRHITIDVAMGLYAIHKAGFMHGDLKPDNIIITGHHDPARGIIAKITDFGGSMETVLKGNKAKHFIPLWAAPEVQNKDADIDWEKADVYSYGLVIGSLWGSCRNGLISWSHGERSSSIFSALAMPVLDDIESHVIANDFLWLGKIEDRTINNVKTQLEHNAIDQSLQNEILELVTTPLRTHFWLRPDTNALALSLVSFASETGRDIVSEEMANTEAEYSEPDKQNIEFYRYRNWEKTIHNLSLIAQQAQIAYKGVVNNHGPVEDMPAHLSDQLTDEAFLDGLQERLQKSFPFLQAHSTGIAQRLSRSKSHQYMSYIGFIIDNIFTSPRSFSKKIEIIETLSGAALRGLHLHMATFSVLGTKLETEVPVRAFLSLLALSDSQWAMQLLSIRWPSYVKIIRRIIGSRRPAFESPKGDCEMLSNLFDYLNKYIEQPPVDQTCLTLDEALNIGAMEDIKAALGAVTDATVLKNNIPCLLHQLSKLTDGEAVPLARIAFERGARLDVLKAVDADGHFGGIIPTPFTHNMSPLSAAISRGKIRLALEILEIHVAFGEPLADFTTALRISFTYLHHEIGRRLLQANRDYPHLCQNGEALCSEQSILQFLQDIIFCGGKKIAIECQRLVFHGGGYDTAYRRSLEILFAETTESSELPISSLQSILDFTLKWDDLTATKALIKHFQRRDNVLRFHLANFPPIGDDIVATRTSNHELDDEDYHTVIMDFFNDCRASMTNSPHLSTPTAERKALTVLAICLAYNAVQCFEFFLEQFPDLIEEESANSLLHMACRSFDIKFVELLLKSGADTTAKLFQFVMPLTYALSFGNVQAADLIQPLCSRKNIQNIFNPTTTSVAPLLFCVLIAWKATRDPKIFESIKWLIANNGVVAISSGGVPYWRCFLDYPRPCARSYQLLDRKLIDLLLGVPALAEISKPSTRKEALTMIHFAAWHGHTEVVRRLVEKEFDPNITAGIHIGGEDSYLSPLDFALLRYTSEIPQQISRRGYEEIRKWIDDLREVSMILYRKGYRSRFLELIPESLQEEFFSTSYTPAAPNDATIWPLPLPSGTSGLLQPDTPRAHLSSIPPDFDSAAKESLLVGRDWRQIIDGCAAHIQDCVQQLAIYKEKRESVTGIFTPDMVKRLKEEACVARYKWRLPPNWKLEGYCGDLGALDIKLLYSTTLGDGKLMTPVKPPLYSGN